MGSPSVSRAHPAGIGLPQRSATDSLPSATVLVAMSRTNGYSRLAGAASEIGFVPSMAWRPWVGTTSGPELVRLIPIMSCGRAIME